MCSPMDGSECEEAADAISHMAKNPGPKANLTLHNAFATDDAPDGPDD